MKEIIKRMNEINARKAEIRAQLQQRSAEVDLPALENEVIELNAELASLEQRKRLIEGIGNGSVPTDPIENPLTRDTNTPTFTRDNVLASPEYRSAFAKTLMRRSLTDVEKRALDVALTTTDTTYGAPSADADGVNNGGLFIPTSINLALMEAIALVSPIFKDAARTAIPGLLKFPYKKAATNTAKSRKQTEQNDLASYEWAELVLGVSEISETIRISWKLEVMAVDEFLSYIQAQLIESVQDVAAQEFIYGDGDEKMSGVTKDAIVHTYEGTALDGIGTALGELSVKDKIGAKIYVAQSIVEEISFSKDNDGKYIFTPINGVGINSISAYKVEVDPYLKSGEFVIGNVHKYSRLNIVEAVSITKDTLGRKRANDYTVFAMFGAATQPGTLVHGKKKA